MRSLFLLLIVFSLSGCGALGFPGVYRIDVEQGNLVEQDMVDQLQPGMSRRQVRFILGTPLVEDPFNNSRWDYPYVLRNGTNIIREAQMSVYFDGDSLVDVTGDYQPAWASGAEAEPATDASDEDSDNQS